MICRRFFLSLWLFCGIIATRALKLVPPTPDVVSELDRISTWKVFSASHNGSLPMILKRMPAFKHSSNTTGNMSLSGGNSTHLFSEVRLHSSSEQLTFHWLTDPWFMGKTNLHLVTVETRPNNTKIDGLLNPGANWTWEGLITKLKVMTFWLKSRPPSELVIFVDGGDTLFGGCTEKAFFDAYEFNKKQHNGASIVIGAERGCYKCPPPWTCQTVPQVPGWAFLDWNSADAGATWGTSPLDSAGQMRFLNSGFLVGPAGDLKDLFNQSLARMEEDKAECIELPCSDQYYVYEYFLQNQNIAVLDYASQLVTNGYSLNLEKLFELQDDRSFYNRVTRRQECFFHANGQGDAFYYLRAWQQGAPRPW